MKLSRFAPLLALAAALSVPVAAHAQGDFPRTGLKVIVPFAPGGAPDIVARLLSKKVGENLGREIVVENRVGAGGNIGFVAGLKAPPDGYTILICTFGCATNPALFEKPGWQPSDIAPVMLAGLVPNVLVIHAGVKARTTAEFIALAKSQPGKMNYGSGGNGTNTHVGGELFKSQAGVDLVHVPYKGAGAVLQDLMAGQVQALVTSLPTALPHIRSGRLRALMVTADKRSSLLPDVPSAKEAGLPNMVMTFWIGFAAPAGTPQPIVDKLNGAMVAALKTPEAKKLLAEQALEPVGNTPAQAAKLVEDEMQRWAGVVKAANIKAD